MGAVRITERASPVPFAGHGGDTDGVVRGVVICGLSSANGRVYPPDVLRKSVAKYEGAQVYLDHPTGRGERGVREWFGEIRNVRSRPDGRPEGDLHYDTAHPFAGEFRSRAEKFPRSLGLSHVAYCQTSQDRGGRERVESIERVESVDLVASPATNAGIRESKGGGAVAESTLRTVLESLEPRLPQDRRKALRKVLVEADDGGDMAAMMDSPLDAPAPDADPAEAMDEGFANLMHAQLDSLLAESHTFAEFLTNIRALYKTRSQITGKGGNSGGESSSDSGAETETEAKESRGMSAGLLFEAAEELEAAGLPPRAAHLRILSKLAEKADRAVIIDGLKSARPAATGAEKPESGGRHQTARFDRVKESKAGAGERPAAGDPAAFKKWVTESN